MEQFLSKRAPFPWQKKGLVYEPSLPGFSHGSHPCAIHYKDDIFIVAFTSRDKNQHSHIFLCYAEVTENGMRLIGQPKMALMPGEKGFFDCDGVISVCFVEQNGTHYLYYVGWQNLPDGLWCCDTGRSILDPHKLELHKEFLGPVFGRDKHNPLFAAATAFHIKDNVWHSWYNSGKSWQKQDNGWKHFYGIHHAHSNNGIEWHCDSNMCIPFADEYEYAFGRPSVYYSNDRYYMWFAHRATKEIDTYRIGFATSIDGLNWDRDDSLSGIDVSQTGWDSEMICYPYIIEHKNQLYMLYNGNNYGKTGFGLAVMEIV